MKSLKKALVALLALGAIFWACEKHDATVSADRAKEQNAELERIAVETGLIHNAALDHLAEQVNLERTTEAQAYLALNDYFLENASSNAAREALLDYRENGCDCTTEFVGITPWVEANAGRFNSLEHTYLLKADEELNRYLAAGADAVAKNMAAIQADVLHSEGLDFFQKKRLLGTISILANSILYWDEAYRQVDHPWYSVVHKNGSARICWQCVYVAVQDGLSYNDCLGAPGWNEGSEETAEEVCANQAAYASTLAAINR